MPCACRCPSGTPPPGKISVVVSSPVSYFGGKTWLAERLAAALPPHKHYIECCAGSLAVLLAKRPSRQETVNDIDQVLMRFWRVLRDRPDDLERACSLTPHSRAERELAYEFPDDLDELEVARRVWIALTQGRTGSITRTGWRHHAAPTSTPMPVVLARYARRLAPAAKRIQGVSLECRPAVEMVQAYGRDRQNLLYVDPPYIVDPGTRRGGEYRVEMTRVEQHRELLDACIAADAAVVISGYGNKVYDSALGGWYRYSIPTSTQQGSGHGRRTEVVWSNRRLEGLENPLQEAAAVTGQQRRCPHCLAVVKQPKRGRRIWCGEACRIAAWRATRDEVEDSLDDEAAV